jgi:hypothetical protein
MASTVLKAYTAAAANALTTELNALANNANTAASAAIDNTTNLDLFMDLELILAAQGTARSSTATVAVFMTPSLDGTNYTDANEAISELVAVFPLDAATTARRAVVRDIPLSPALFKLFARNQTGQALAASGTSIRYRTHSLTTA